MIQICTQIRKVSDAIKTGLQSITKEYDNQMKVTKAWQGTASNKISKKLNFSSAIQEQ